MAETNKEANIHLKYPFSHQFRDLWKYAEGYRGALIFYFLVVVVVSGIGTATPYLVGLIIDAITRGSFDVIPRYLFLMGFCFTTLILGGNWVQYKVKVLSSLIVAQTKIGVLRHLFTLDFAFYESVSLGTILSRADQGAGKIISAAIRRS